VKSRCTAARTRASAAQLSQHLNLCTSKSKRIFVRATKATPPSSPSSSRSLQMGSSRVPTARSSRLSGSTFAPKSRSAYLRPVVCPQLYSLYYSLALLQSFVLSFTRFTTEAQRIPEANLLSSALRFTRFTAISRYYSLYPQLYSLYYRGAEHT
jgi:hypothetical protein